MPWYKEWMCVCVQEGSVHTWIPEKKIHRDQSQSAERSPYVGRRCRRVCVKKALER